jgi:hypothetical protein
VQLCDKRQLLALAQLLLRALAQQLLTNRLELRL